MKTKQFCLLLLCALSYIHGFAQNSLWTLNEDNAIQVAGERKIIPSAFKLAKLSTQDFKLQQTFIPDENSGQQALIDLPTPDGGLKHFSIFEVPMMEAPLAAKYPQIKTYTAIQIDNPLVTAKIDYTVFGFHAMVFDNEHTYFIDPYTNLNTDWYMVYYKKDFVKPLQHRMHCDLDENTSLIPAEQAVALTKGNEIPNLSSYKQNGTDKRVYRLALACTVEYSAAVGGTTPTKASVLSAMVTSMNRVNGVFEKDFSMHANLVGNNDTLIYIGTTDPYTNNSGGTMLSQNQTTVNARIGSANYDYGHVFSTGGGGVATAGCVCSSGSKAQGVTGSSNPVGDPFDIDYVAHEMGHQFGGMHTFNSVTGSCSGNRSSQSAYEIGSATTILGYAGICGNDDIQPHSDDYYHIRSLEQMTGTNVTACPTLTPSNNALPILAPIRDTFIIPYKTPFELTASGSDPDNDPLTYCWEEYDRGGSGAAWDAVTTNAPIFRSFFPSTSPTRVFPALKYLLQNVETYKGEILPVNARILKFRCTLRDLKNGYGAFYTSTDTLRLDVRTTAELFRVTSQNVTGAIWQGWSPQTITWNVAGTDVAPILTPKVNIYLSIDSGKTWPYTLASNVPNNGTANVTAPNVNGTWCRVKVKGADNVFFDLNDNWFSIQAVTAPASVPTFSSDLVNIYPNPSTGIFTFNLPENIHVDAEILNEVGRVVWNKSIVNKETIQLSNLPAGIYMVRIKDNAGRQVVKKLTLIQQ